MIRSGGISLALGALATALALGAGRAAGRVVSVAGISADLVIPHAAWALVCAALAGAVAWRASRRPGGRRWAGSGALLWFLVAWAVTIGEAPPSWEGLPSLPAGEALRRNDGPVHSVNAAGFRGPAALPAGPGRPILAVVGDSFVFGIGVEDGETFTDALTARLPQARIANLGIPGTNLDTHVRAAAVAQAALGAPVVLVTITWANDFARWDASDERAALSGPGLLSLGATVLGPRAALTLAHLALFDPQPFDSPQERLRALDSALSGLDGLAERGAEVFVLLWRAESPGGIDDVLSRHRRLTLLSSPRWDDSVHFQRDGHPTPAGHEAAAEAVAASLALALAGDVRQP